MKSGLYRGSLRHRRFHPIKHEFEYNVFYYLLDLDELSDILVKNNKVFKNSWLYPSFSRENYFGQSHNMIKESVQSKVSEVLGRAINGSVRMLTQLTVGKYCFNPLTLYYCYDDEGTLTAVLAHVSNTPWNERHTYVLDMKNSETLSHPKAFHVSPLLPMDMQYQWQITAPAETLKVHINDLKDNEKWFDATLNLTRYPFTAAMLRKTLWRQPLMTYKIIILIHWQALILKLKGAKYYPYKPKSSPGVSNND